MSSLEHIDGKQRYVGIICCGRGTASLVSHLRVLLMNADSPIESLNQFKIELQMRDADWKVGGTTLQWAFLRPLSLRFQNIISRRIDDFCMSSLSWIDQHSHEELPGFKERARSIARNMIAFVDDKPVQQDWRFGPFIRYLWNKHSGRNIDHRDRQAVDELGGLVLYYAARYKDSLEWLGNNAIERSTFLVSWASEILRSTLVALYKHRNELGSTDNLIKLQKLILMEQLNEYGIRLKYENLGKLRACLISTKFGLVVHLNERLSAEEQEFACLHELGHLMLRHRANSDYALDPNLLTSEKTKGQFIRQEQEANGFAELWRHMLHTIVEDALVNPSARDFVNEAPSTRSEPTQILTEPEPEVCGYSR